MVVLVFFVAVINFAIGFGIGMWLEDLLPARFAAGGREGTAVAQAAQAETPAQSEESEPPKEEVIEEPVVEWEFPDWIPEEWLPAVESSGMPVKFLAEAAIQFLLCERQGFMNELTKHEDESRDFSLSLEADATTRLVREVQELLTTWLSTLADTSCMLGAHAADQDEDPTFQKQVIELVEDNRKGIAAAKKRLTQLDLGNVFESGQELINEICKLAMLGYDLRDKLYVAAISGAAERLPLVKLMDAVDTDSELPNRIAAVSMLQSCLKATSSDGAHRCAALLRVDDLHEISERWGMARGNELLAALATRLGDLVRDEPRLTMVARYTGSSFLAVFSDCEPADARELVDGIRKDVEASHLIPDEKELVATLSGFIAPLADQESSVELLDSLYDSVKSVQSDGGNKTRIQELALA